MTACAMGVRKIEIKCQVGSFTPLKDEAIHSEEIFLYRIKT